MIKVRIKDYQALRDVELTVKGFVCIVGEGDLGKSSIRRAIEAAVYGQRGDSFISWGSQQTEVTLEFDDFTFTWSKKKGEGGFYKLVNDTVKAESLEKALPDSGLKEIVVNDRKFRLNVFKQFSALFLVNNTPGDNYVLFSSILYLSPFLGARGTLDIEIKNKNVAIEENSHQVDSYRRLLDIIPYSELEANVNRSIESATEISDLVSKSNKLAEVQVRVEKIQVQCQAIQGVLLSLDHFQKNYIEFLKSGEALQKFHLFTDLHKKWSNIAHVLEWLAEVHNSFKRVIELSESVVKLNVIYNNYSGSVIARDALTKLIEHQQLITSTVTALGANTNLLHSLNNLQIQRGILKGNINETDHKEAELLEVQAELKKFTFCPFCNSNLTKEHNHG